MKAAAIHIDVLRYKGMTYDEFLKAVGWGDELGHLGAEDLEEIMKHLRPSSLAIEGAEGVKFPEAMLDSLTLRLGSLLTIEVNDSGTIEVKESVRKLSESPSGTQEAVEAILSVKEAIAAFLEDRKFRECSPKTLGNYSHFLRRFIGQFNQVPSDHKLIRSILSNFKGQTKETYWLYFSAFYRYLEHEYGLPNPMARLPRPREQRRLPSHLNPEQKIRLAQVSLSPRDRALVSLFSESAVRPGEVIGDSRGHPLRFCDIYEDHIRVSGKSGGRIVPITPQTRDGMLQLQGSRPSGSPVFTADDGHALTYWGLRKIVATAFRKAGITAVKQGPYTLRHSFGGDFLAQGGDVATLQKILGHANIKTTMIYTHIADKQVMNSYRRYGPSAINCPLIAPKDNEASSLIEINPAQQLPELLDQLIALGQRAQELRHAIGGNGHWPEELKEVMQYLEHRASK